ncbi:unnamed protein product, partial [Eruca vesicaria subsp. sativa]|nr:unnamed protein product [Eruca vesicaria subsp. sativa]
MDQLIFHDGAFCLKKCLNSLPCGITSHNLLPLKLACFIALSCPKARGSCEWRLLKFPKLAGTTPEKRFLGSERVSNNVRWPKPDQEDCLGESYYYLSTRSLRLVKLEKLLRIKPVMNLDRESRFP